MIKRNENKGMNNWSIEIFYFHGKEGMTRTRLGKKEMKYFFEEVENLPDERKQQEGIFVENCLLSGEKVVLHNGEIRLFWHERMNPQISQPSWIITGNEELYSLLKNIVEA